MRAYPISRFSQLSILLVATVVAIVVAGPAEAGKNNPAPIVYAGQGTSTRISPERSTVYVAPVQSTSVEDKARARIQFRYPDQPDTVYGNGPARLQADAAPMAYAASQPAVRPEQARQYASIDAPQYASAAPVIAPAYNQNTFDAQAAAAAIAAQQQAPNVQSEALPALVLPSPAVGQGRVTGAPTRLTPAVAHSVSTEPVPVFDESGIGIVYGDEFAGLPTANGEIFDQAALTAAHPSMPLPSLVQVINTDTQTEIIVRVNDRGPFEDGAMLQMSKGAADALGVDGEGRANIRVRYLGPAPVIAPESNGLMMASIDTFEPDFQPQPKPVQAAYVPQPSYTPVAQQPAVRQVYQPVVTGNYYVQLGSFVDIANAHQLQMAMPADMQTIVVQARVNGADYFRVRTGPFTTRDGAAQVRDNLYARGVADGRVVTAD